MFEIYADGDGADIDSTQISKLTKDLRSAAKKLTTSEARYLVDSYYAIQDYRIVASNQVRAMNQVGEPSEFTSWLMDNMKSLENNIKSALNIYTDNTEIGAWVKSICGIGPVLAAGLVANIDITKAPTAGHIWRFAGLDNEVEWLGTQRASEIVDEVVGKAKEITHEHIAALSIITHRKPENIERLALDPKTEQITKKSLKAALAKRPWNARFKVVCWKIGESFVKVSGNPKDVYGKLYIERKVLEQQRNEAGLFADQAEAKLKKNKIGKDTDAYKSYSQGMLPPAHIHARAKRYAVKIFLSHYQAVAYKLHYGIEPPKPFAIAILGHAHEIPVPIAV